MTVVFYGITNKIVSRIDKYISIAGEPCCFSTKDEEINEYKDGLLLNKYEVLSLAEVLKRYPDADIWVTYCKPTITAKKLLQKFSPEKIHFFEADLEYRKGCRFLGHFISYRKETFSPCCITKYCPVIETSGSIPERMAQWKNYTTELLEDIRNDKPNDCSKCPHLKYGFYPKEVKLDMINFGTNQPGDVCNFNCIYCFCGNQLKRLKHDEDGFTTYEILRQLSLMPEYDTSEFTIQLSNGEFCVNKHCNEIFDILLNNKWKAVFLSNMSVYNKKFAQFLETGRAIRVLVSIDAGTPETFKKVKGADCLDKVVANLKKYSFDKTKLCLKYIFLEGLNDNEADIDGFYEIAKSVGCDDIVLSSNLFKPFTEKMRELTLRIINKAKNDGIVISSNSSYLCAKDAAFINKSYIAAMSQPSQPPVQTYDAKIKANGNSIIYNPYRTGKITGDGELTLNAQLIPGSNAECTVLLGNNSNLVVNGDFSVHPSAKLELMGNSKLIIGSGFMQSGAQISCAENITIGNDVIISANCFITDSATCPVTDKKDKQPNKNAPVTIGNQVWIGRGAMILKGVTIGNGAIIAPGTIVTRDIPPYATAEGNPVKIKKKSFLKK